ncbi:MAG: DNA polymerase Y family protein [Porticoccaceae bacterium]|nr:DNA polymerase Y family protein [Porticoccaceae bacterium]
MLWLCLRFPLLPLEVFIQDGPTPNHPAAVMDQHRVLVANSLATVMGIKPGISLATAQALCPEADIFDRDIERETHSLQTLAYSCYRFTPAITLCPPDHLLLEIAGCLKLFKGLQGLLSIIDQAVADQGYKHTIGLATTPKAAVLFSRIDSQTSSDTSCDTGRNTNNETSADIDIAIGQDLHALPLNVLDCSNKLKDQFRSTGFCCLGDLLCLPGGAVGKRYGKDFLIYLKQLTGERPDPQQALKLPPQFERTLEFNDGITSTEMLAFPMKRLLIALSGYLHGRQLHCSQIRWLMGLSSMGPSPMGEPGGNNTEIILHFAQPHNNLEHFLSLSRLKLDKQALSAPVENLSLCAVHLHTAEQKNTDLFGAQAGGEYNGNSHLVNNNDLTMVLDKLRTRLGEDSVCRLSLADSHIPEQAWQIQAFTSKHGKNLAKPKSSANTLDSHDKASNRPLWLFQNPAPVQTKTQSLYWQGSLNLLQGPERIEGNWWQKAICRDYFIASHNNGALYWVYRDRLSGKWFVHGAFG